MLVFVACSRIFTTVFRAGVWDELLFPRMWNKNKQLAGYKKLNICPGKLPPKQNHTECIPQAKEQATGTGWS